MAVHKVPQDVEADDKFLGPLSFKQFLFFGGALITGFLMFQTLSYNVPYLSIFIFPFFAVCVMLAFPWTKDQPTELWLAARIRFLLVQHKRIWDQDDIKELVTITVPKREAHIYTDGLSQTQVKSRLNALASVVDSRGWALTDDEHAATHAHSDRLVPYTGVSNPLAQHDEQDSLGDSSPLAQQFTTLIQDSEQRHKQDTRTMVNQLQNANQLPAQDQTAASNSPWFLHGNQPQDAAMQQLKTPSTEAADEQAFLEKVRKQEEVQAAANARERASGVRSAHAQTPGMAMQQQATTTASDDPDENANASGIPNVDPAILALAQNDDLNVETIARQANIYNVSGDDEVVISLHENR